MFDFFVYLGKALNYFGGIVTAIIFIIAGISSVYSFISKFAIPLAVTLVVILFLLIVTSLTLYKLIRDNIGKLQEDTRKSIIKDKLSHYSSLNNTSPFKKIIPSNSFVKALDDQSISIAKKWDQNAALMGFTLFIKVHEEKVSIDLLTEYHSSIKKEDFQVQVGTVNAEQVNENLIQMSETPTVPFYVQDKNWRKSVLASFEIVKNKLPNNYSIQIPSSRVAIEGRMLSINIRHKNQRMNFNEVFRSDGHTLKYEKTGQIINL